MLNKESWVETQAHKFTRGYLCARCAARFRTPHEVYHHIDNTCKRRKRRAGR